MPSEFWTNVTDGLVSTYGISSEALLIIFAIMFATGLSSYFAIRLDRKEIFPFVFFLSLTVFVFFGIIDWIIIILPLLFIGVLVFLSKRGTQ